MSTPNELAAALMVDHADVVTDAKRARDRVTRIGSMLAQYAATITVEQLTADAQALLVAGEDIRRYERVAAHLLAAAERLTADDHPDASEADTHNQGRPVEWIGRDGTSPGVLVCAVPSPPGSSKGAFGHGGRLICGFRLGDGPCSRHDEPGPGRTGQDDTGPDRTETGRMVADTGYPTAPANGPEAAQ